MKKLFFVLGLFSLLFVSAQEKQINIKLNPALTSIGGDENPSNQVPLVGVQFGAGVILPFVWNVLPFQGNWFYNPMFLFGPGGQGYKSGGFVYGDCWRFLQLPNTVGVSYPIKDKQRVTLEAGPSVNFLLGAQNFYTDNEGKKVKNKVVISDNENFNRINVSGVIEASYTWEMPRFDVSVGLKGDLGITPTVSYKNFSGDKVNLRAQSISLTLEISNPLNDLLGKERYSYYPDPKMQIEPEVSAAETTYDLVILGFRKARLYHDKSKSTENPDSSKHYAELSLAWQKRAKQWLNKGVNEWNDGDINNGVGPTNQRLITRYLNEIAAGSQIMVDSVWKLPPPIVETPTETGDDPRDTPPPIAYGEEVDPPWIKWEGAFEPSQGVWQDDVNFVDKHSKQLTKVDDQNYVAELDMIADRWTGVFGVRSYKRFMIRLKGTSTYSQYVRVKYQLKIKQNGSETILWTEPKAKRSLPIAGPVGDEVAWESVLFDDDGDAPVPSFFKMKPGEYILILEVIKEDGTSTGISIQVSGNVVTTSFPLINIVPVSLSEDNSDETLAALKQNANNLAIKSRDYINQQFPLPENSVSIKSIPIENLGSQKLGALENLISLLPYAKDKIDVRYDKLLARMIDKFATQSQVNPGSKVVVLLGDNDYALIRKNADNSVAFAPHRKVVFVRHEENESSVAHELIHTFPLLWSKTQMIAQCDLNYHNSADNSYGWGSDVTANQGKVINGANAIMSSSSTDCHITQCTYWNLLWNLQGKPDPELYLVRGYLYQDDSVSTGVMENTYEIMGEEDLEQGIIPPQGWGISLRDISGQTIARFPFVPNWLDSEDEEPHKLVAFNHRINRIKGAVSITLVGPNGDLVTQIISKNAPKLSIASPKKNAAINLVGGKIRVAWVGTDQDNDTLSYLVYYAPDGKSWRSVSPEQNQKFIDVDIYGTPSQPTIKVIATDGVRSVEKTRAFFVKQ